MTYTKATLADLDHAGATATATGAAVAAGGASAVAAVTHLEQGVGQVTDTLVGHVHALATAMREEAERAAARLGAADWEGRAREAADTADRLLRAEVDRILGAAESDADVLRESSVVEAAGLLAEIRGRSQGLLADLDGAYRELAGAQAAFADDLIAADHAFQP